MSDAVESSKEEPKGEETVQAPLLDVQAGDYVRLTPETMIDPDAQNMSPVSLFKLVGWPNKFMVVDVLMDVKHGQVLRLDPCCGWIRDPEDRSKFPCQAHPSKYFERHPEDEHGQDKPEGDRYMGVNLAGLDLLSVEYLNGGKEPSLVVKFVGQKPLILNGKAAKELAQILKSKRFL